MSYKDVAGFTAFLWLASILLPVTIAPPGFVDHNLPLGLLILLLGWLGVGVGQVAWFANVGFWTSFFLLRKDRQVSRNLGFAVAAATTGLGLSAFLWNASVDEENAADIVLIHYGPGFYCWLLAVLLISGALGKRSMATHGEK